MGPGYGTPAGGFDPWSQAGMGYTPSAFLPFGSGFGLGLNFGAPGFGQRGFYSPFEWEGGRVTNPAVGAPQIPPNVFDGNNIDPQFQLQLPGGGVGNYWGINPVGEAAQQQQQAPSVPGPGGGLRGGLGLADFPDSVYWF